MRTFWDDELTPEQEAKIIANLTKEIGKRKLEAPAILALEAHKPLANMIGHGLVAASPFLAPFLGMENVDNYSQLLGNRESIERLIISLEESAQGHLDNNDEVEVSAIR